MTSARMFVLRALCTAMAISVSLLSGSAAEGPTNGTRNQPSAELRNIMVAVQIAHTKLWLAGKLGNWKLADYELDQIKSGFERAAGFYPDKSLTTAADKSLQAVRGTIDGRDATSFAKAYTDLTNACNACHRATNRAFITIQVPASSPFPDQLFVDQVAEGRGLAHAVCGACHVVSEDSKALPAYRIPTPSFPDIARRPAFSEDGLRQMLSSSHRNLGPDQSMPNPRLNDYQVEEIVAYFESLRTAQ